MRDDPEDRSFFQLEVERMMDFLYGTARRLTRNPADAEDLVSEAVVRAWAGFGQLRDRRSFPKWIMRILTNTYISNCRAKHPELLEDCGAGVDEEFSLFEQLHQPFLLWWGNPEQELVSKLLRQDIESAVDGLPDCFRTVMVLVEIEGCSYSEVAGMLDVPIGTVRSRLSRARSLLQRALWHQARDNGLVAGHGIKDERMTGRGASE